MFKKYPLFPQELSFKRKSWPWITPLLALLIIGFGQAIAFVPVIETGLIPKERLESYPEILYMLFAGFGAMVLLLTLWVKLFEGRSMAGMGLSLKGKPVGEVLKGLFFGVFMSGSIVGLVYILGGYELEIDSRIGFEGIVIVTLLLSGFMIQSSTEELIFRGWLFGRLSEQYGLVVGIAVNAALFILLHLPGVDFANITAFDTGIYFIGMFLFSLYPSLMVINDGSVWRAGAWHAGWNWFFITGFGLATTGIDLGTVPIVADLQAVEGQPRWLTGGEYGPEASAMMMLVLATASAFEWRKYKDKKSVLAAVEEGA